MAQHKMNFEQIMERYDVPRRFIIKCPQCGEVKFFTNQYSRLNCKIKEDLKKKPLFVEIVELLIWR